MATLLGYFNMKEKHGKVLILSVPIEKNGCGFNTYTKCVFDEVADTITPNMLGKELKFGTSMEVV
jgi:hypothetical protein